jgi:hypothetical protein
VIQARAAIDRNSGAPYTARANSQCGLGRGFSRALGR